MTLLFPIFNINILFAVVSGQLTAHTAVVALITVELNDIESVAPVKRQQRSELEANPSPCTNKFCVMFPMILSGHTLTSVGIRKQAPVIEDRVPLKQNIGGDA